METAHCQSCLFSAHPERFCAELPLLFNPGLKSAGLYNGRCGIGTRSEQQCSGAQEVSVRPAYKEVPEGSSSMYTGCREGYAGTMEWYPA